MLKIAIVCSHRVPGLEDLLNDPDRGVDYEIACVITNNRDLRERDAIVDAGITCIARPQPPKDLIAREEYDAETARYLKIFDVELVVLCCYLRILTAPMLAAFPGRIINLHDSDLPKYVGLHATRDAIHAGERETRATAHWVTEEVDAGPVLLRSEAFPVLGDVRAHRELVIRTTWGSLMRDAIHLVASRDLLQATA